MWTMLEGFEHLTTEEMDILVSTPVWIMALIGSADGEIDRDERAWADRLMRARTYSMPGQLGEYYRVVAEDFLDKVANVMDVMPAAPEARCIELAEKITGANPVLAKLDLVLGAALYKSFLMLAKETAKASGGFLRIGAVSAAEHKWMQLPMLTPIVIEGENPYAVWEDDDEKEKQ